MTEQCPYCGTTFMARGVLPESAPLPTPATEAIKYVDATPNEEYPIRILGAYLEDARIGRWAEDSNGTVTNPIMRAMNEDQDKRAEILARAIGILASELYRREQKDRPRATP